MKETESHSPLPRHGSPHLAEGHFDDVREDADTVFCAAKAEVLLVVEKIAGSRPSSGTPSRRSAWKAAMHFGGGLDEEGNVVRDAHFQLRRRMRVSSAVRRSSSTKHIEVYGIESFNRLQLRFVNSTQAPEGGRLAGPAIGTQMATAIVKRSPCVDKQHAYRTERANVIRTQALIVGGGPSGLAAAIALGHRKIDCVVVDALSVDADKACGEGLMPDTLASLAELGVVVSPSDGYTMRGIRFLNETSRVTGKFPRGEGAGVRRPWFRRRLAQAASDAGATVLWNTRLQLMSPRTAIIDGKTLQYDWLIGADGNSSAVRTRAGLSPVVEEHERYAVRRHYRVRPWSSFVELHWGKSGQVCVAPVGDECVSVIFMSRHRDALRRDPFSEFPELTERLRGSETMTSQSGAVTVTRRLRRVTAGNTALIGDASGSVDAITGEGLGMAFRQAVALAECIQTNRLSAYDRKHRALGGMPHRMGALLLMLDRFPAVASLVLSSLAKHPECLDDMLAVHLGEVSAAKVLARRGPLFALSFLATLARQTTG